MISSVMKKLHTGRRHLMPIITKGERNKSRVGTRRAYIIMLCESQWLLALKARWNKKDISNFALLTV
jgi:hypothetical protein